jgi:hypothetical protein
MCSLSNNNNNNNNNNNLFAIDIYIHTIRNKKKKNRKIGTKRNYD